MLRLMSRLLIATVALVACAGTPDPVEAPSATATETVTPEKTSTAAATSTAEPSNHARELSGTDCAALAGKYGALFVSDEMAKLPAGLSSDQIALSRSQLEKGAELAADRWKTGCVESLVGKEHPEKNLHCAMAAKSVNAFDVCLNGPPPEAPPDAGGATKPTK